MYGYQIELTVTELQEIQTLLALHQVQVEIADESGDKVSVTRRSWGERAKAMRKVLANKQKFIKMS
jgi:hypothetical protein